MNLHTRRIHCHRYICNCKSYYKSPPLDFFNDVATYLSSVPTFQHFEFPYKEYYEFPDKIHNFVRIMCVWYVFLGIRGITNLQQEMKKKKKKLLLYLKLKCLGQPTPSRRRCYNQKFKPLANVCSWASLSPMTGFLMTWLIWIWM